LFYSQILEDREYKRRLGVAADDKILLKWNLEENDIKTCKDKF
jgi:hypothetical protein